MLPNWLYTQSLIGPDLAAAVAAGGRPEPSDEVVAALLGSALNKAPGGLVAPWEQVGRAVAALGAECATTSVAFAEHLAEQYRQARVDQVPAATSATTLRRIAGPPRVVAEQRYAEFSPQPYLVHAALLVCAAVGIATDALRRDTASTDAEILALGDATTDVLTAQAAVLRVLSMLDALRETGRDADGTVSAGFHTVVRGAARSLATAAELVDGMADVRTVTAHQVLCDRRWARRVAASLRGDWTPFERFE